MSRIAVRCNTLESQREFLEMASLLAVREFSVNGMKGRAVVKQCGLAERKPPEGRILRVVVE
jgi:hypothetical protein